MAGDELRSTHSDRFISRISPEYLCMPSPSLEIMYTAGRSSAVSLKLLMSSFAVIRWNDACLSEAVLEDNKCCMVHLKVCVCVLGVDSNYPLSESAAAWNWPHASME